MDTEMCRCCKAFYACLNGLCSECQRKESLKIDISSAVSTLLTSFCQKVDDPSQIPLKLHNPTRCFTCNKRVASFSFKCKCEFSFCSKHRLPEEHNCNFDHKSSGIKKLSKENPLVVAQKLNKL